MKVECGRVSIFFILGSSFSTILLVKLRIKYSKFIIVGR